MVVSYTQEITLDINTNTAYQVVSAKQGDTGSRWVLIHLTKNNIPYSATPGNNAQFRCRKPDGHAVINPAVINNDGTITVELTSQTLAVAGRGYADVVESDGEGNVLSSVSFILLIMAAPDVAGNATSSDEFQKLNELVSRSDELISEAEAWARGTKNNMDIGDATYVEDTNVTMQNFARKKPHLFIKVDDTTYQPVAPSATFDPTETYYGLGAGDDNNAKYYAEQAQEAYAGVEDLTVSSQTLAPGSSASVEKTIDSQTGIVNLDFGIPQGIQGLPGQDGDRGPSTVWIGTAAPTDEAYTVWLNPEGTATPLLVTSNQVSYDEAVSYNSGTIGSAVNIIEDSMENIQEVADRADAAADRAEAAAEEMEQALEQIDGKITSPTLPQNSGFLTVTTIHPTTPGEPDTAQYAWQEKISYNNDLLSSSLPKINNRVLQGSLSLNDIGAAPRQGSNVYYTFPSNRIPSTDLADEVNDSLNLADSAVQIIRMNNTDFQPSSGTVDLGIILTAEDNANVNKNYLDNPWFTVNQRGITSYNGNSTNVAIVGTYICDRWKIVEDEGVGNRSIDFNNGILHISTATLYDATKSFSVGQLIDDDTWKTIGGRTVTASINFGTTNTDYQTESFNFLCPEYNSVTSDIFKYQILDNYGWGLQIKTTFVDSKRYLLFEIIWAGNAWGTTMQDSALYISKVKLELGIVCTLDLEGAPIYNEELVKCQRYFRCYGGENSSLSEPIVLGQGIAPTSTSFDWILPFQSQMIAQPHIVSSVDLLLSRSFVATASSSGVGTLPSANLSDLVFTEGIDDLYAEATASSVTANNPYFVVLPATVAVSEGDEVISQISFSAEP